MYATVTDFRDEGITEAQALDDRLTALIEEASASIDRITGWFFESRGMVLHLDGRGAPSIEPPYPPIELTSFTINKRAMSLDNGELIIIGAPVQPGFIAPRFTLRNGIFPKGNANIEAEGTWGFTEPDGTPTGRTPLAVRRACMLMVLRMLPLLGNTDDTADARNAWRIRKVPNADPK